MKKAPALVKRLTSALVELGYTTEEAQDMISNEGTASIAAFIQDELKFAKQQQAPTASVTLTPTGEKDMALKCEVGTNGKYKSVETIDTGYGVQAAKPLPKVEKQVPTVVEPTSQISSKPTANQELMYDYNKLPSELQRLVDDISLHKLPTTAQLPVMHIVGWNQDESRPVYKLTAGQSTANVYYWLYMNDRRAWQNMGCIIVAPTDPQLLKIVRGYLGHELLPAEATFKLMCPSSICSVATLDLKEYAVVVPPPASEPKATAKVAAKARKADAKAEAEAPTPAAKKEPVTEQLLSELASATNHMKKVSLVNKVLTALGEPKVASKITKVELQPTIERLLKTLGVAPAPAVAVAPVKEEKAPAKAKAKAAKEPKAKAPTKAAIEAFYVEQLVRETGCTEASAKKQFKGVDVKWTSSIERAEYAQNLGMTLEVA